MSANPRIHAEMIKAWADGYQIESFNTEHQEWFLNPDPNWSPDVEYRVRPGVLEPTHKEPEFAEYVVRVEQDPLEPNYVDLFNSDDLNEYNLRLLFRDDVLVEATVIDEDAPW
jgi:hypothetical protein